MKWSDVNRSFFRFFFSTLFLFGIYRSLAQTDSTIYYNKLNKSLKKENNSFPVETEKNLNRYINFFEKTKDSINLVESYIELSEFLSDKGEYNKVFKNLWKALAIAKQIKDIRLQHKIYTGLTYLYISFDEKEQTLICEKKVLQLSKEGVEQGVLHKSTIVSAYYNFLRFYRQDNQLEKAKAYLDTCYFLAKKNNYNYDDKVYLLSEKGAIKLQEGKIKEAIDILEESKLNFLRLKLDYLPIIYFNLGNAYATNGQLLTAEKYYLKTLEELEKKRYHYDYKTKAIFQLSKTLKELNKHKEAFEMLMEYKELSEQLFSPKSIQNKGLFEIPNLYEEQIRKKDEAIKQRNRELLEQKATLIRFELFIITTLSIIVIGLLFFYVKYQHKKFKLEKEKELKKAELQKQKNENLIELKNKELTSYTLRLIDKDNLINELIENIDKYAPKNEYLMKLVKQKIIGKTKLWKQFDKRFIDVNKDFYDNLKNKSPNLTPTELKHCALIKLNFSAKEMAQLLNISINGVNTSRYRIRKKLELHREDNLTSFISSL